jgi:hypothetical protein
MNDETPTLLIVGNPVDGFDYYGPFPDADAASEWAENNRRDEVWWTTKLTTPKNED